MKALLLAAGPGTRLSPITDTCPKAMVPVNGKPILVKQIENLLENEVNDITIIAGYKAETIISKISTEFMQIKIVQNEEFSFTNNMYSAYLGCESTGDEPFLMMNSDVYFDSSIIKSLLFMDEPNAIVTDIGRYLDESMKVVEKDGRLVKISKNIAKNDALGSSIDVYKFSTEANKAFFTKCEEYINTRGDRKLWSEVAINDILSEVRFVACPLNGRWVEIDTHEDLVEANRLFSV